MPVHVKNSMHAQARASLHANTFSNYLWCKVFNNHIIKDNALAYPVIIVITGLKEIHGLGQLTCKFWSLQSGK